MPFRCRMSNCSKGLPRTSDADARKKRLARSTEWNARQISPVTEEAEKRAPAQRKFIGKRYADNSLWYSHLLQIRPQIAYRERQQPSQPQQQQLQQQLQQQNQQQQQQQLQHQQYETGRAHYSLVDNKRSSWSYKKRMPQFIGKRANTKIRFIGKRLYNLAQERGQELSQVDQQDQLQKRHLLPVNVEQKRAPSTRKFIGKRKSLFIGW